MIKTPTKKLLKKDWILTAEAFEDLLKNLEPDREKASLIYEDIRKRLIRQFKAGNSSIAEEQADEVFNRIARKYSKTVLYWTKKIRIRIFTRLPVTFCWNIKDKKNAECSDSMI